MYLPFLRICPQSSNPSEMFVTLIVSIDRLSYLTITQFTSDLDHSPYPGTLNSTGFASAGITCRKHIIFTSAQFVTEQRRFFKSFAMCKNYM